MLEKVNFDKLSREEYDEEIKSFEHDFSVLEQEIKEAKLPVIILFEGWGAAGKGELIGKLIKYFDPRGFNVFNNQTAEDFELRRPMLWRYWLEIPLYGKLAILDRSWYEAISIDRVEENIKQEELNRRVNSIKTFERQLTDDGYLIIKFFLHISQKEQKKRFDKLSSDKNTAWRVTDSDRGRNREYKSYFRAFDEMLTATDTVNAPWHILPAKDKLSLRLNCFRVIRAALTDALKKKQEESALSAPSEIIVPSTVKLIDMPKLSDIPLTNTLSREEYKPRLDSLQKELHNLQNKAYRKKVPIIIAYEGWDAAGKGGNIKRVTGALDPRGYEVVPISSPTAEELNHHYLWRFWKHIPKDGHTVIFDRTWYGRVMVERIEGFTPLSRCSMAYMEINEFERDLYDWGAVIVKFWLQIDKDEQLRRFTDRQNTPEKQWKITDEDWRNRDKWDMYENAVNEMFRYTSTDIAPWHVIESQDKRYGRVEALEILIDAIKERL